MRNQLLKTEPLATLTKFAGMLWLDTSQNPPRLKLRDTADSLFEELLDGGEY